MAGEDTLRKRLELSHVAGYTVTGCYCQFDIVYLVRISDLMSKDYPFFFFYEIRQGEPTCINISAEYTRVYFYLVVDYI